MDFLLLSLRKHLFLDNASGYHTIFGYSCNLLEPLNNRSNEPGDIERLVEFLLFQYQRLHTYCTFLDMFSNSNCYL